MARVVRVLVRPVRAFVISKDEAEGFEPLDNFRCGDPSAEPNREVAQAIKEVHRIAGRLYRGEAVDQRVVLLEERAGERQGEGDLVGFCGVRHLPLYAGHGVAGLEGLPPGGYVNVIGTGTSYRGVRVKKKGTSPGSRLLSEALAQLKREFGGGPLPYVWAAVLLGNRPSVEAFQKHHFRRPPPGHPRGIMFRQGETGGLRVLLQ